MTTNIKTEMQKNKIALTFALVGGILGGILMNVTGAMGYTMGLEDGEHSCQQESTEQKQP